MSKNSTDRTFMRKQPLPPSPLVLTEHVEDLLREPHGFGSFLFDTSGEVIVHNDATWLYTTVLSGTKWESWVRPFAFKRMQAGLARRVLAAEPDDRRGAVLHHVIQIAPDFIVGFFSGGKSVQAAVAAGPDQPFQRDPSFKIDPVQGWETQGGPPEGWVLEVNGALVKIQEDPGRLLFWQGYDSYLATRLLGDLAWAKIMIDKKTRRISLIARHPSNPLPFRRPAWSCARCGGNLSSNVRIRGRYAFFYYFRPARAKDAYIALALCKDPLFQGPTDHFLVDRMRGREEVAEKFQAVPQGKELLLFSESRFQDQSWHTGVRRFSVL